MKWTKKAIMDAIMEKVDAQLQKVGEEDQNRWKNHTFAVFISLPREDEPLAFIINGRHISTKQYRVFRAVQTGLFVYLEDVADGEELLAQLIAHWCNASIWSDDVFSKTDKGVFNGFMQTYNPLYNCYTIVTNILFNKST